MLGVASNGGGRKGASLVMLFSNMGLGNWGSAKSRTLPLVCKGVHFNGDSKELGC